MKNLLFIPLLLVSYLVLTSSSCKHDDKDLTPGNPTTGTPGSGWRVSLYSEPGENKTSDYNGYTFDFTATGAMTAAGNGQNVSGTWRQFKNDGVTKFEIDLSTSDDDLKDLNHAWVLVGRSDVLISLADDNALSNEVLQFSK